jgi:hypothetical protein
MRGEGTCSAVSWEMAEVRACFSCTRSFHHEGTEKPGEKEVTWISEFGSLTRN